MRNPSEKSYSIRLRGLPSPLVMGFACLCALLGSVQDELLGWKAGLQLQFAGCLPAEAPVEEHTPEEECSLQRTQVVRKRDESENRGTSKRQAHRSRTAWLGQQRARQMATLAVRCFSEYRSRNGCGAHLLC